MTAVFLTPHYWGSDRRTGMHWLADALVRRGWDVLFVTLSLSWPVWIRRRDYRLDYPVHREANRLVGKEPGVTSFVWLTPWHPTPLGSPGLDRLAALWFRAYARFPLGPAERLIREADLLVFDGSAGLLLFDRLRRLAPTARTIYRMSDDLRFVGPGRSPGPAHHSVVVEAEIAALDRFDLISTPSRPLYARHAHRSNARFHPHGIRSDLFEQPAPDPYPDDSATRAIFVGARIFDREVLRIAADVRPHWHFHIIGPLPDLPVADNIIAYGELPFESTIRYLRHADVGLCTWIVEPGTELLAESLKVLQYTYCRLPIVGPSVLPNVRDHFALYAPDDPASIAAALDAAEAFDHAKVDRSWVRGWDDIIIDILRDVGLDDATASR